ncbi:hypothetical protein RJ639_006663 [Escallonia herrerae]|uniref:ent-kaurene synthase n=1 Tax=Escallonia herrerae TaxID=1293975 RepID=A0AA88VWW1_9ASTE|nr:hypothetical protein RJ639_006663 [Escallonia herrerae]
MESSLLSIQALVTKIKLETFSPKSDLYSFVSPSAYDTAWLAMVQDPKEHGRPLYKGCLDWVMSNQKEEGYWGVSSADGLPTIDTLPATLACLVALKTWNASDKGVEKGLAFVHAKMKMLVDVDYQQLPRWFAIVFPGMVELARATGLELVMQDELKGVISSIFKERQRILETEKLVDKFQYPPILSYLEALPSTYEIDEQAIVAHLSENGSIFNSPSATACAYMATGNQKCMDYLESFAQRCPYGVPSMYPMDRGLIKLSMVDHIQKLGLGEHFQEDIDEILEQFYRTYRNRKKQLSEPRGTNDALAKIYKDSLTFRLLRMHGYNITPRSFCWFLNREDILDHLEQNCEHFRSLIYNVYRATDVIFAGEYELEEARMFSKKLLEKTMKSRMAYDNFVTLPSFRGVIEQELSLPWIARLDHLDHRMWIEENRVSPLWTGKASFYRLTCLQDENIMQLAMENYKFRQLIYRNELEELKRWSKDTGLSDMGFGREKTSYCYFAVAASSCLPHDSLVRMIVAKSAILITVADDFFDMKGALDELQELTEAVQRWDGKSLRGPSKVIFAALVDFVTDIAKEFLHQKGSDITRYLQDIWRETFFSWLLETTWSNTGYIPSADEYLKVGMTSIATHTIVLPSSCFLSPRLPDDKHKTNHYETITKLLMATARLLNDIQSYQKEQGEGKMNLVLLHLKENPDGNIEDSIGYVKNILDEKRRELLQHVLMDELSDLPKPCKHLHLSCLKVFQMFFDSGNRFDSNTELLQDIKKAIYDPPEYRILKPIRPQRCSRGVTTQKSSTVHAHFNRTFTTRCSSKSPKTSATKDDCRKLLIPRRFSFCFI